MYRESNFSFSRSKRLTESHQFVRLFDRPQVFRARTYHAFCKENDVGFARLGITIKGKISSVWRMRLKRIVREWFRKEQKTMGSKDINVVLRVSRDTSWEFADQLRVELGKIQT